MARRLILDTGVLIDAERGVTSLRAVMGEGDDVVVAAVTVAELRVGVDLAREDRRASRAAFVDAVLDVLPVESYDLETAQEHGRLLAHVHRTGTRRGAHDLIIAATAARTARTLVTTDARARFGDLPGVACQQV